MFEIKGELNVNVNVELGEKTRNLLGGQVPQPAKQAAVEKEKPGAEQEQAEATATGRTRRSQNEIREQQEKAKTGWNGLSEEDRLEAIKTEVTKQAKKGKSRDIKAVLDHFDAPRASELDPNDYKAFYDAILRYGEGVAVEDLFDENAF